MVCPGTVIVSFVILCKLVAKICALQHVQAANVLWNLTSSKDFPCVLDEGDSKVLDFEFFVQDPEPIQVFVASSDPEIATVEDGTTHHVLGDSVTNISVKIKGLFLGRTYLRFLVNRSVAKAERYDAAKPGNLLSEAEESENWYQLPDKDDYEVAVSRHDGPLNHIFTGSIIVLVCLANVAMGCKTQLSVIKETMKKPIAPITGLVSQFILMPMISFAVSTLLKFSPVMALGMFAMGCSPGGAASNVYTYFLGGDVSLSVTMTFVSTVAALGFVPLWLFTLGIMVIYRTSSVRIPYENIVFSLVGLLIPVGIGILIQRKRENWAKVIVKAVKPIMIIFILLIFTVGVYANLYIFSLMSPLVLLAGALIPWCGFLFGGLVALATRQPWKNIVTIAIETGIQNTGIAIVLLKLSLPAPDNDISIVAPISAAIFTPVPMIIAIAVRYIYRRWFKKEKVIEIEKAEAQAEEDKKALENGNGKCILYKQVVNESGQESEGDPQS